jgi:hypothetical protein
MPHARSAIRALVVAQLKTGTAALAENVTNTRMTRPQADALPAIDVRTTDDDAELQTLGLDASGLVRRQLTVVIRAYAQADSDVGTAIDDLCADIEARMALLPAEYREQPGFTTAIELDAEAERPMAEATLEYQLTYYTQASNPATLHT